jgi:hypothetical protein
MLNANANYIGFGSQPRTQFNTPYFSTYTEGDYQIVKFWYESGSAVAGNGTGSFLLPDNKQIEYLIIGGGGSGGGNTFLPDANAGAGAGQLLSGSFLYLGKQLFNFVVGSGAIGSKVDGQGNNGADSYVAGLAGSGFINLYALGGGGGGSFARNGGAPAPPITGCPGANGGSGGGGGFAGFDGPGGQGFPGGDTLGSLGSDGGQGINFNVDGASGGGGGAITSGSNGRSEGAGPATVRYGGDGGSGSFSAISGSARYYAGGGGGGSYASVGITKAFGSGGVGGGGTVLVNGEEQTGSGGGGFANGGSGVIILRWNITQQNLV